MPGTLVAILPLLALRLRAETHYARALPPTGDPPTTHTVPAGFAADWNGAAEPAQLRVRDGAATMSSFEMHAPVGIVTKKPWWHRLAENPLGYLPADAPVEQVRIELPRAKY